MFNRVLSRPRRLIAVAGLLAILVAACQPGQPSPLPQAQSEEEIMPVDATPPGSTPEPSASPTPLASPAEPGEPGLSYAIPAGAGSSEFARYRPIPVSSAPAVPLYSTSVAGLANPDAAQGLSPAQRQALEQNGFVVTPATFPQIYQIYQQAREQGQPVFVTTDALLHTYHVLYDFALREAEINYFVGDLQALTAEMLAQSQAQAAGTAGEAHQAALRNVAYFSVAASLLDPNFSPPSEVADLVAAELALIEAHGGFAPSPIFGFREDYSQYVPRGHYTRNETFERYFRAMMWYGRIGFRLRPGSQAGAIAAGRMETRQAILISAALGAARVNGEPALAVWDRIYQPTVFFVGRADDLTVYDYLQLIRTVYGETLAVQDLNDVPRLDDFIRRATALRPPRIVAGLVTDREDPAAVTQSFRFMGQRFVPDAYIFQQLVYAEVGTQAEPRQMPLALDVAAVLGSERALDLLLNVYDQGRFENYTRQMETLRADFAVLPPEQWSENLYWGWLYSLQPLLDPPGAGYPVFMQSPAWIDKDLQTYLGSWTELKHDTILYAKQSTTLRVTSIQPEPARVNGYVEPRPEVYARLAALANQTRRGLAGRGLLSDEFSRKFGQLEDFLRALAVMAEKELAGQGLTRQEQDQVRNVGDLLERITTFSRKTGEELASEADERLAIVADVHTDPNSRQVLQEAVGDAFVIWVVAPIDGQPTLAQGGVFSYYEFPWPLADRLTDESWQALQSRPDQPAWTKSFVVP
ncbi:MAG: DUF3160 domain-containing protein [Anaerolineae bacterium]